MHAVLLKYAADAGRLCHRLLAPAREEAGLTQGEMDILLFLANNPEYDTASDIVSIRRLAKSNVSVGIKSLEAKGLLRRSPDSRDRRIEHLSLTPAAGRPTALGRQGQARFAALLLQGLSPEELRTLERLTAHIQQNLTRALDGPD